MYAFPFGILGGHHPTRSDEGNGNTSDSSGAVPVVNKYICANCENSWQVLSSFVKPPDLKHLEDIATEHFTRRVLRAEEISLIDNHTAAADLTRCSRALHSITLCDACVNYFGESEKRILKAQKTYLEKMKGARDFNEVLADPWFDLKKFAFHKLKDMEPAITEKLGIIDRASASSSSVSTVITLDTTSTSATVSSVTPAATVSSSGLVVTSITHTQPQIFVESMDFEVSDSNRSLSVDPTCQFTAVSGASCSSQNTSAATSPVSIRKSESNSDGSATEMQDVQSNPITSPLPPPGSGETKSQSQSELEDRDTDSDASNSDGSATEMQDVQSNPITSPLPPPGSEEKDRETDSDARKSTPKELPVIPKAEKNLKKPRPPPKRNARKLKCFRRPSIKLKNTTPTVKTIFPEDIQSCTEACHEDDGNETDFSTKSEPSHNRQRKAPIAKPKPVADKEKSQPFKYFPTSPTINLKRIKLDCPPNLIFAKKSIPPALPPPVETPVSSSSPKDNPKNKANKRTLNEKVDSKSPKSPKPVDVNVADCSVTKDKKVSKKKEASTPVFAKNLKKVYQIGSRTIVDSSSDDSSDDDDDDGIESPQKKD